MIKSPVKSVVRDASPYLTALLIKGLVWALAWLDLAWMPVFYTGEMDDWIRFNRFGVALGCGCDARNGIWER